VIVAEAGAATVAAGAPQLSQPTLHDCQWRSRRPCRSRAHRSIVVHHSRLDRSDL